MKSSSRIWAVRVPSLLSLLLMMGCGGGDEPASIPSKPHVAGEADVAFIVTPDPIVDRMLELAEIQPTDVVYDLGCGDGRIVIAAAKKYKVKAVGIEIQPDVVEKANANVKEAGVVDLVTIRQGDIFEADFRDATVVMMYLLPDVNVQLMPKLKELREGTRIVSHSFPMKGAKPHHVEVVKGKKVYMWRLPWKPE